MCNLVNLHNIQTYSKPELSDTSAMSNDCRLSHKGHLNTDQEFSLFDDCSDFLSCDFTDVFDHDKEFFMLTSANSISDQCLPLSYQFKVSKPSEVDIFKAMFPAREISTNKRKFVDSRLEGNVKEESKPFSPFASKKDFPSSNDTKKNSQSVKKKRGGKGKVKNPKYALNSRNMQVFGYFNAAFFKYSIHDSICIKYSD